MKQYKKEKKNLKRIEAYEAQITEEIKMIDKIDEDMIFYNNDNSYSKKKTSSRMTDPNIFKLIPKKRKSKSEHTATIND